MPRGVPANGFRMTRKRAEAAAQGLDPRASVIMTLPSRQAPATPIDEPEDVILARLTERFEVLETMALGATEGDVNALIVSGPAGLGKSYTIEETLREWDPSEINHTIVKGYVRPTGLYKLLYQHRNKGQVLVFDDADSIFYDDVSLNLLKAACDSNDVRKIAYRSEAILIDEDSAERLPQSFVFEGTIIFITNLDFDALIDRGHKLAPHLGALVSRAHYIDLAMKTKKDYLVRIRQVVGLGMLTENGLNQEQQEDVMEFITDNADRLRELSLRMVLKISTIRKQGRHNWRQVARITCCKAG